MSKALYTLPSGEIVEIDDAVAAERVWVKEAGGAPYNHGIGGIKAAANGVAEGAARLPFFLSDILNLGLDTVEKKLNPAWMQTSGYKDFRAAHKGSGWLDQGLAALGGEFYKPKTDFERYSNLAGQGVGGGVLGAGVRMVAPAARTTAGVADALGAVGQTLSRAPMPTLGAIGDTATAAASKIPRMPVTMDPALIRSTAKAAMPLGAVAGATGGMAGLGLQQATGEEDNPLVGLAGNVLGGMLPGWWAGGTSRPSRMLGEGAQSFTPVEWKAAQANLAKFKRQGATTATLGEAFPGEHSLLGLTREATTQSGSNALTAKLAERGADLTQLTDRALNAVGPQVNPTNVAAAAEQAAKARLAQFRGARSAAYNRRLAGAPPLDENRVAAVRQALQAGAQGQQSTVAADPMNAIAEVLLKANPETRWQWTQQQGVPLLEPVTARFPKTDVQALATDLKSLRSNMEYNPVNASTPKKLDAFAFKAPYKTVNDFLRKESPGHYVPAERSYRYFTEKLVEPAEKSPLGAMAGRSAADNAVVPVNRMEQLVVGQDPSSIGPTMRSLAKGGDPDLPQQVARAILQNRVRVGGEAPSQQLLGGSAGSLAEAQTNALVRSVGPNVRAFAEPVEVMQLLERVKSGAAAGGSQQRAKEAATNLGSAVFAPFQEGWVRLALAARKANYRQAAWLLANPSEQNLKTLQQLAQSDPAFRRWLTTAAGASSVNAQLPAEE